MAERKVKPAGGNSNVAATYEPEGIPTASDDIVLASTSGNFTINAALACRSFIEQAGYVAILKHEAVNITIGTSTAPPENKALVLQAGSTYTLTNAATSKIIFAHSVASTIVTADLGGKTTGSFEQSGTVPTTSGVKLLSALTSTGILTLSRGIFNTNGQTISVTSVQAAAATFKEFVLGSSSITVTSNGGTWNFNSAAASKISAGTSTIKMTAAQFNFGGGEGQTYNRVEFFPVGSSLNFSIPQQNMTINELIIRSSGASTNDYRIAPNLTVGKLEVLGSVAEATREGFRVLIQSADSAGNSVPGVKTKITATETVLENCDFMDIEAAGAAEWKGTRIGDCGGNSGITFDASKTRYLKTAGNLSATATYSATSGGASGASVPLPQDKVIGDANSGAGTYTLNIGRFCADLDLSAFTRTLSVSLASAIYGSQTFATGMTLSGGQGLSYRGRGTHTVKMAGKTGVTSTFYAPGGSYTMSDAHTLTGALFHHAGVLDTASFNVECSRFEHAGTFTSELKSGSSVIVLSGTGTIWTTTAAGLTLAANTAIFKSSAAIEIELRAGGLDFNGGSWELTGTGLVKVTTFKCQNFTRQNAAAVELMLTSAAVSLEITGNLSISGSAGNLVTVTATTPGSAAIIKKGSGIVSLDYVSLKDSKAEGGAAFYAGTHSTNVSGNTGWNFEAAPAAFPKSVVTLDNCNRENGPLYTGAPQWSTKGINSSANQLVIKENRIATEAAERNATTSGKYGPDFDFVCEIPVLPVNGSYVFIAGRIAGVGTPSWNGYGLIYIKEAGADVWGLRKYTSGSSSTLGATFNQEVAAGDSIGWRLEGSKLSAWWKPAGGEWTPIAFREDATYSTSGPIGIELGDTTVRIDNLSSTAAEAAGEIVYTDARKGSMTSAGASVQGYSVFDSRKGSMVSAGTAHEWDTGTDLRVGKIVTVGGSKESAVRTDTGKGSVKVAGSSSERLSFANSRLGVLTFAGSGKDASFNKDIADGELVLHGSGQDHWSGPAGEGSYTGFPLIGAYDGTSGDDYSGLGSGEYDG